MSDDAPTPTPPDDAPDSSPAPSDQPQLLSSDAILRTPLETRDVHVPEWGGTVRVRELAGTDRDQYEIRMGRARGNPDAVINVRSAVVAMAAIDADGNRVFTDGQIAELGTRSAKALDRVFDVVDEISGLSPRKVDEAVEDFDDAPDTGSSSA